jgi:hypothetical protein
MRAAVVLLPRNPPLSITDKMADMLMVKGKVAEGRATVGDRVQRGDRGSQGVHLRPVVLHTITVWTGWGGPAVGAQDCCRRIHQKI